MNRMLMRAAALRGMPPQGPQQPVGTQNVAQGGLIPPMKPPEAPMPGQASPGQNLWRGSRGY